MSITAGVASDYLTTAPESVHGAVKSVSTYRQALRSAVRGLWSGILDYDQALNSFRFAVSRHLTQAWMDGAKKCDIGPDELSEAEQRELAQQIANQNDYIGGYLEAIEANSKANGGKLTPLYTRLELWVNRWDEVSELAQSMACADRKAQWQLGRTEKHCQSCLGFHGRVYRFSVWRENGALPRSSRLSCRGFRCDCRLTQTDAAITKGRFPRSLLQ